MKKNTDINNTKKGESTSKQQLAYNRIKNLIISNSLKPDTLIVERKICASLNISRTPLREALRRLASEGFVEIIPEKGAFVSHVRLEDMIDIFELREVLESLAIRLFIIRAPDEMVEKLEECFKAQLDAFKDGKNSLAMEKDMEFHRIFIVGSKNRKLRDFLNTILDQAARIAISRADDTELIKTSIEEHRNILKAVREKNTVLAEQLVKNHFARVREHYLSKYYLS
jgi:DNA-binding GntR family transcriptional regulator